jgi:hypothetical protein
MLTSLLWTFQQVEAGPASEALTRCLTASASSSERTTLAQWMFLSLGSHPDTRGYVAATPFERAQVAKQAMAAFQRLIAESCPAELKEAVRLEGQASASTSFGAFGTSIVQSMMKHPSTAEALASSFEHFDVRKLEEALSRP